MAFATHWRTEFDDIHGITWKVDIQEDAYGGAVVDLKATGDPLEIEYLAESDNYNEPIRPSRARIRVYATTDFALATLYSEQDFKYKVIIYYESTVYWQGYIETGTYEEPYEEPKYEVVISATDGLSYLKSIMYDDDGTYYADRILESQIILDILGKIEITQFTEYINLYEESMDDGTTDSPLDQIKIDADIFRDMTCFEVLAEVLKKYDACIIQRLGEMCLYRPTELTGATVYGRAFTGATTKSGTSITPVQYINRTLNTSDMIQTRGSWLSVKRGVKTINVGQDYGSKESYIDNWDLKSDTYNPGTLLFDDWTDGALLPSSAGANIPDEFDGLLIPGAATTVTDSVYQSFGDYLVDTSDVQNISISYLFNNTSAGTISGLLTAYVKIKANNANKWLDNVDNEYAEWAGSESFISLAVEDLAPGKSAWQKYERKIAGLDVDGPYTITLYNSYHGSTNAHQVVYKDIKLYSSADSAVPYRTKSYIWGFGWAVKWKKGFKFVDRPEVYIKNYTKTNTNGLGQIDLEYMLGDVADSGIDNVLEQYGGSLMSYVTTLQYRVDKILLTGTSGTATVTCDAVAKLATFDTDLATTAANFVSAYATDYLTGGVVLTSVGDTLIFTSNVLGAEFTGSTTIATVSGDLSGSVSESFTAASFVTIDYTTDWNTRGGSESTQLIDLIGDEVKTQYSRPKQLLTMMIQEKNATAPKLDVLKRVEDEVNQYSGNNRTFVFIHGSFNVKSKKWTANLIEII